MPEEGAGDRSDVVTLCTGVTREAYRNPGYIFCIRHTCLTGVLSCGSRRVLTFDGHVTLPCTEQMQVHFAGSARYRLNVKNNAAKASEIGTMDSKPAQNIQDTFLNTVRKDKTPITIYLVSGVKLTGRIRSFDKYSVLLENNSQEQLIFKHAISTVVSNRAVMHEHRLGHPSAGVPHPQGTPLRQEAES